MITFIKKTLIFLLAAIIYGTGMNLYQIYSDRVDKQGWDFETIAYLVIAVIIVTSPVINYWEAKLLKLFGMNREEEVRKRQFKQWQSKK